MFYVTSGSDWEQNVNWRLGRPIKLSRFGGNGGMEGRRDGGSKEGRRQEAGDKNCVCVTHAQAKCIHANTSKLPVTFAALSVYFLQTKIHERASDTRTHARTHVHAKSQPVKRVALTPSPSPR